MLELGIASSHPAGAFRTKEEWEANLVRMLNPENPNKLPHTAQLELETPGVIDDYIERVQSAFATLREEIQSYKPDALIMIGDDQGEMFGEENNPIFAIYTGDEPLWGRKVQWGVPFEEREKLSFPVHTELSRYLHKGLVKRGFDVANLGRFEPRGPEAVRGSAHMVSHVLPQVDPELKIPIICVLINEYFPPLPSAERCAALGEAIADVFKDRPERIAIYASGGLSHFPGEFNVGWLDEPLDHWVMERLEQNDLEALKHLFTFDSQNLRSGTGEIRAWIAVSAALKRPAEFIDYIPAHGAVTALGYARWPLPQGNGNGRNGHH